MAPEQLHGGEIDQRVDVYALGVVLYELLTGKRPFDGQTAYDIAAHALTAPLKPPSAHDPSIPAALDRIILKALSRDPSARYPSMAEFALALHHAISQQTGESGDFASAVTLPLPDRFWSSPLISQSTVPPSRRQSPRWLIAPIMLLTAASLAGTLLALQHSGRDTHQTTNSSGVGPIVQVSPTSPNSLGSNQTPQPSLGATPEVTMAAIGTPNAQPTSTATAYVTTLTIAPTPLVLTPISGTSKTCSATQTVTNNTTATIGWAWQQQAVPGFHFQIDGRHSVGWPTAATNTPPNGQDTLVVTSDCKPQPLSYTILVNDSLGGQYSFVMTVQ